MEMGVGWDGTGLGIRWGRLEWNGFGMEQSTCSHTPGTLDNAMGCANSVFPWQDLPPRAGGDPVDLAGLAVSWLQRVCDLLQTPPGKANQGELAAFVSYAVTFPCDFQGLLDTYCVRR